MLEHASLVLRPWQAAPSGGAHRVRPLVDDGGAAVGFVHSAAQVGPWWLRWLGRRTLEVYENPDNSLVFALRRRWAWSRGWQVVDADQRLVGTVRGRAIVDGFGHFLAVIEPPHEAGRGRLLGMQGRELGLYDVGDEGVGIKFAPDTEGNPFARMLLLGAVLVSG